jgi:hypothetical protein
MAAPAGLRCRGVLCVSVAWPRHLDARGLAGQFGGPAVGGVHVPSCGGTVRVLVVQPVGMLMCRGNLPHVGKRGCRPGMSAVVP